MQNCHNESCYDIRLLFVVIYQPIYPDMTEKMLAGMLNIKKTKVINLCFQFSVILAPYGLNGTLTGVTYRDTDPATLRHLKEWKQFYPVKIEEGSENDMSQLPNLVEVLVGRWQI